MVYLGFYNLSKAALARLEALESDYAFVENVEISSDEDGSLDGDDQGFFPLYLVPFFSNPRDLFDSVERNLTNPLLHSRFAAKSVVTSKCLSPK